MTHIIICLEDIKINMLKMQMISYEKKSSGTMMKDTNIAEKIVYLHVKCVLCYHENEILVYAFHKFLYFQSSIERRLKRRKILSISFLL